MGAATQVEANGANNRVLPALFVHFNSRRHPALVAFSATRAGNLISGRARRTPGEIQGGENSIRPQPFATRSLGMVKWVRRSTQSHRLSAAVPLTGNSVAASTTTSASLGKVMLCTTFAEFKTNRYAYRLNVR